MAAKTIKGITVEIGGNTTKLGEALKDSTKKSTDLQNALKQVNKALKMDPTSVELLTEKQKILSDAVQAAKDKLNTLKEAQDQVAEQYRNGEIDQGAYLAFQNELEQAKQKLEDLERQQRSFGNTAAQVMQEAGRQVSAFGEKVSGIGDTLTKNVSAPIAAVGTASVAAFNQVDEGLDTIVTATGASGEALEGLRASYEAVATQVPEDFATIGAAIGEVNTRFQSTGKTLEDQTALFLKFAQITGGDVVTAVDTSDKVLESWGRTAADLPGLLGMTAKAAQDTGINAQSLLETVQSNGASFRQLGFSLEETIQLLAQMDANGVESSTAITGLKKAVTNLTDAGMSESDALRAVIDSIKNAKTETEALEAAQEVFGTRGAAEMVSAIREGRLSLDGLAASMGDYGSVVEDTYAGTVDGIDSLKTTANAGMLALSEFGSVISDMLAPVLQKATEFLNSITEKLKGMDEGQKQTIVTIAGLVAAIGPVLSIGGKIISGVGTVISVLGKVPGIISTVGGALSFLATPAGLVVAGIAAVVAGFTLLYTKCEGFRNLVDSVVETVKGKWEQAKEAFAAGASAIGSAFSTGMEAVRSTASTVMEAARATVAEKLNNMRAAYEENGGGIKGAAAAAMEGVKGYFTSGLTFVDNLTGGKLSDLLSRFNILDGAKAKVSEIMEGVKSAFSDKIDAARQAIDSGISRIKSLFNFSWSLPQIKMPHFSISGSFSLNPPSVPHLSVSWYKQGGILSGAQIFGRMGDKLLGGGEAGQEAVLPLDGFYKELRQILAGFQRTSGGIAVQLHIEHFENSSGQDVDELTDKVAHKLQRRLEQIEGAFA